MMTLLEQFLAEAAESLDAIGATLIALEQDANANAPALVATLFRQVHTLKGNCGLFDFPEMTRVLHAAEDLMDSLRAGRLGYSSELADRLLAAMDFVGLLCQRAAQGIEGADPALAATAAHLAGQLRALLPAQVASQIVAAVVPSALALAGPTLCAEARALAAAHAATGTPLRLVCYVPDAACFFQGDDPLHRAMTVPGLVWGGIVARTPWPALAELDAYRCNLDFHMLTTADDAALVEHFRYVPEQWQVWAAPATADAIDAMDALVQQTELSALPALLAAQRELLTLPGSGAALAGRLRAAAGVLAQCLHAAGREQEQTALAAACEQAIAADSALLLSAWMASAFPSDAVADGSSQHGAGSELAVAVAPAELTSAAGRQDDGSTKVLRVEQSKIDRLLDLIGEMVVAKNAIPFLAQRAANSYAAPELAREITAQYGVINRIAEAMQDAIMQVRMLPMSFIFQRFPRLVRDLARRLGKEVTLQMSGQDTAADKTIIEALGDPLLHILRNSLDHGFEDAATRVAAGKPACGTLRVAARQQGDRVIIEISDDGRGIDPQQMRRSASAKGLLTVEEAARLSDQEAVNLVFAPGFSTAAEVSDISGRGVGMDAVRSAVQKVQGSLELDSTAGIGTRICLSLPLSMAITDVLIIETDGQRFGVPMDAVRETVRLARSTVRRFKNQMVVTRRGRVLPLRPLNEVLGLNAAPQANANDELAVLVLGEGEHSIGLLVDQFHHATSVILKPLGGLLGSMPLYSGSALMGDGAVLMVLNPQELR